MAKYRKKGILIEAEKWDGGPHPHVVSEPLGFFVRGRGGNLFSICAGDYIIDRGDYHEAIPEILFESTYEEA